MRNLHKFVWIIAIGALIIASVSCKTEEEEEVNKPYTTIDPAVLGKWYGNSAPNPATAANTANLEVEFKVGGTGGTLTLKSGTNGTFTATNGTLTGRTGTNTKDQVLTYVIDDTAKSISFENVEGPTVIPSGKFFKHFDADIVGKWYFEEATTNEAYEFKNDGTIMGAYTTASGSLSMRDYYYAYGATFSAAGGKLTAIFPGETDVPTNYTIVGKKLTITHPAGVTDKTAGFSEGDYYKK